MALIEDILLGTLYIVLRATSGISCQSMQQDLNYIACQILKPSSIQKVRI